MPTVAVLADPPVEGAALPDLAASTPLSRGDAARLYGAMLADVCEAVQAGAGELLVNYRPAEQVPADVDPQRSIAEVLEAELPRPDEVRYEVQVGESRAARAGNTATHLLESEGVDSVALVEPTAAFFSREVLGTVAMKLRTREAVLGPTTRGRVYLTGLVEPIDFEDAFAPPAIQTLTACAREADLDVDYAQTLPVVETADDLLTAVPYLRALVRAGRNVPPRTAAAVADLDLHVAERDGHLSVERG